MSADLSHELVLALRLLLSAVLGALIGIEREFHDHPAGMRTHLLVSVGSASFTVLSIEAFQAPGADPGRIAAQIVSGIGFLGAGAILKEGATIRGLTTAASLWTVAAVGMAAGAGSWAVAATITAIVVFSLWPLRLAADRFVGRNESRLKLQVATDDPHALGRVVALITERGGTIAHLATDAAAGGGLTIDLEARMPDPDVGAALVSAIDALDGIRLLSSTASDD